MSSSLSPRQVESVERWLDDQPESSQEKRTPRSGNHQGHQHPQQNHDHDKPHHPVYGPNPDNHFDLDIDPEECFLRVCSSCLASAILGVGAVTILLVQHSSPLGGNRLDINLNWVIGIPVAGLALVWHVFRLGLLAWHKHDRSDKLLVMDVVIEAILGVGSVICAILAGFQAGRHMAYNKHDNGSSLTLDPRRRYLDIGPEIGQTTLLSFLAISSFGILALAFIEASQRKKNKSHSSSSSVIEIIA